MSLDKVTGGQERLDTQSQSLISLADMEQFMQSRQQTVRPLHYMSEQENKEVSDKLTLPKLELLVSDKQAEVTKKAVELLTKGNPSELKQLFDKIRKDGDDASEVALVKAIEKQTGIKVIYDGKSLKLDCLINPGQRDNEKRLGITVDAKGNTSAYSTEQTGLGSGLITKQEKDQDKVISEIKKIASDRLAEYNKKN